MTQDPSVTLRPAVDADVAMHMQFAPEPEIVQIYGGDPAALPAVTVERSSAWVAML